MSQENIVLCDCKAEEVEPLCASFPSENGKGFAIKSHISNWKRTGKMSELRRYGAYFGVALKYFLNRKKYHVIIGWQQFYALIFVFYCSLFHVKKRNTVVALNYTYKEKKGKLGTFYYRFMKRCMDVKYMDYIHVPSQEYAKIISAKFEFPMERIIVTPFGINDPYEKFVKLGVPEDAPKGGYALAIGRSNRDYDFLIDAWRGIKFPLVIISDTYGGTAHSNENIRIIRNVAGAESYPWITHCSAMIIPIDDERICSGDTVLLTAFAMKKKVLITGPSTLAEMYVVHGENGLVSPKHNETFRAYITGMVFTSEYDRLGENARHSFTSHYSREAMGKRIYHHIFED